MRTKSLKKSVSVLVVFMMSLSLFPVGLVEAMVAESEVANPQNIDVATEVQNVATTEVTLVASYDLNGGTLDKENSKFEISNDNGVTWTTVEESNFDETGGVAEVKDLIPETTYTYKATVMNSEGVSATSEVGSFTTLAVPVEEVVPTEEVVVQEVSVPEDAATKSIQEGSMITIDLSQSVVNQPGYTVDNSTHTITFNDDAKNYSYTITGTANNTYRIVIPVGDASSPINITLNNVVIENSHAPIELKNGAHVNLHLEGENTVKCTGTADAGIQVPAGAMLTIDGSGSLVATGADDHPNNGGAGIGAGAGPTGTVSNAGKIVINSGTITAIGGENAAGIGATYKGSAEEINITGGDVTAQGGFGAAGIGDGNTNSGSGSINITGGTVNATGGKYGAGIGGGYGGTSSDIKIENATVVAQGGYGAAGIGEGCYDNAYYHPVTKGSNITIGNGADVTSTGGEKGAGIGSGYNYSNDDAKLSVNITINGGDVKSSGGYLGAGIGGGYQADGGTITINSGTVTAVGSDVPQVDGSTGIGGGSKGNSGTITINGGDVSAIGGENSAGIGGGYCGDAEKITINGGTVEATGGKYGAGIGTGWDGDLGEIYIGGTAEVTASSVHNGAGIGGGYSCDGGDITITDEAIVTASGGSSAAGIGGGHRGYANVTISGDSTVNATGGNYGAGIGGGEYGEGGEVIITDNATVTATGGTWAAGIGGGNLGAKGTVSISEGANVTAFAHGYKAAIESEKDENSNDKPANVANVTLVRAISRDTETTLKLSDANGNNIGVSDVVLPTGYNCFATTTGSYSGPVTIDAYDINEIYVGSIFENCMCDQIVSETTLERTIGVLLFTQVETITLNPSELTLNVGTEETLVADVQPIDATNKGVTWSSSDESVATVDENGVVTAVGVGTTVITATAQDNSNDLSETCELTVVQPVTGVTVNPTELALIVGDEETLVADVQPADTTNKDVMWSSSDETVATVDENGLVTAVGDGTAKITVTTVDGDHTATCGVTVVQPVTGVTVNPTELTLIVGDEETLVADVQPVDATNKDVQWSSSDETVAIVNADGLVTAVGPGSSTITCTTEDGGFTETAEVTVEEIPIVPVAGVDDEVDNSDKTNSDKTTVVETDEEGGSESSPLTGDEALFLTVVIALVSGSALIYLYHRRKMVN